VSSPSGASSVGMGAGIPGLSADVTARRGNGARISLWLGATMVVGLVVLCFAAPILPIPDPNAPDYTAALQAPSLAHLFGTDEVGRDMFSRVLNGGAIDLALGFVTTYLSLIIGVALGAIAGYFRGFRESIIMRLVDTMIAFPFIVLILALVAIVGPGLIGVYVAIIAVGWTLYARLTYSEMLGLRERQFILAAKTLGFRDTRIVLVHAIPNLLRPSLVFSMSDLVLNVLVLVSLSFLGVGVQPPQAEWGALIAGGQTDLLTGWWISTIPGLVVVFFGVGISLLGDGLAARLGANANQRL
jgi:peptide/nickel transport system permease protein